MRRLDILEIVIHTCRRARAVTSDQGRQRALTVKGAFTGHPFTSLGR